MTVYKDPEMRDDVSICEIVFHDDNTSLHSYVSANIEGSLGALTPARAELALSTLSQTQIIHESKEKSIRTMLDQRELEAKELQDEEQEEEEEEEQEEQEEQEEGSETSKREQFETGNHKLDILKMEEENFLDEKEWVLESDLDETMMNYDEPKEFIKDFIEDFIFAKIFPERKEGECVIDQEENIMQPLNLKLNNVETKIYKKDKQPSGLNVQWIEGKMKNENFLKEKGWELESDLNETMMSYDEPNNFIKDFLEDFIFSKIFSERKERESRNGKNLIDQKAKDSLNLELDNNVKVGNHKLDKRPSELNVPEMENENFLEKKGWVLESDLNESTMNYDESKEFIKDFLEDFIFPKIFSEIKEGERRTDINRIDQEANIMEPLNLEIDNNAKVGNYKLDEQSSELNVPKIENENFLEEKGWKLESDLKESKQESHVIQPKIFGSEFTNKDKIRRPFKLPARSKLSRV